MIGSIMVYRTYNYLCYVIIPVISGIGDITVHIVCFIYIYLYYKVHILRLLSTECVFICCIFSVHRVHIHGMVLLHWTEGVFIAEVLSDTKCTYFGVLLLDTEYIALVSVTSVYSAYLS